MTLTAPDPSAPDEAVERALELLRRFGWNSTSFQSLEPGFEYWFAPAGDAVVAYVDTGSAWVAAGAPIAAEGQLGAVAAEFEAAAGRAGKRICWFAVEQRFLEAAPVASAPIGEQPCWNPAEWERTLAGSRSLREQLRRARAKGVTVRPVDAAALTDRAHPERVAIERLIAEWLGRRRMAPMGFLVQVHPFSFPGERRLFVAVRADRIVGFLAMVPVYARNGWLLEDLLRDASAPNGTTELLIDAAMRSAAATGAEYATLGLAPLSGPIGPWLRVARALGRSLYDFEGLRAFKRRLRPDRWDPIYAAWPSSGNRITAIADALAAFAPGGLVRFGLRSVVRTPEPAIRLLALLLVPWTVLLFAVAPDHWFPSEQVRLAWTVFDVGLVVGLTALAWRWRTWLATLLAGLVTFDAVATGVEVVVVNLRSPSLGEALISPVAILGPTLAAALLWGALRHRRSGSSALPRG